jgi:hypothetical protein
MTLICSRHISPQGGGAAFDRQVWAVEIGTGGRKASHAFFLASIVSDRRLSEDPCVNVIQAFYQHWRLRSHKADLPATILQDRVNKRRVPASG